MIRLALLGAETETVNFVPRDTPTPGSMSIDAPVNRRPAKTRFTDARAVVSVASARIPVLAPS